MGKTSSRWSLTGASVAIGIWLPLQDGDVALTGDKGQVVVLREKCCADRA